MVLWNGYGFNVHRPTEVKLNAERHEASRRGDVEQRLRGTQVAFEAARLIAALAPIPCDRVTTNKHSAEISA